MNLTCTIYNGCNAVGTGTLAQAQASVNGNGVVRHFGAGTTAVAARWPSARWRACSVSSPVARYACDGGVVDRSDPSRTSDETASGGQSCNARTSRA